VIDKKYFNAAHLTLYGFENESENEAVENCHVHFQLCENIKHNHAGITFQ